MSFRIQVTDEDSGAVLGDYKGIPAKVAFGVVTAVNQALSALRTTAQIKSDLEGIERLLGLFGIDQSRGKRRRT